VLLPPLIARTSCAFQSDWSRPRQCPDTVGAQAGETQRCGRLARARRQTLRVKYSKPSKAWRPGPVLIGRNCISKRASLSRKVRKYLVVYSFTCSCCSSRDKTCSVAASGAASRTVSDSLEQLFAVAAADRDIHYRNKHRSRGCIAAGTHSWSH
jgi:hypothetical protein